MQSHLDNSGLGLFDFGSIISPAVQEGAKTAATGVVQTAASGGNSEAYEAALRAGGMSAAEAARAAVMPPVPTEPAAQPMQTTQAAPMPVVNPNDMTTTGDKIAENSMVGNTSKTLLTVGLLAGAGALAWWWFKGRKAA